ncbi:AAA family ATPase [Pseudomonas tussilaginis]|uniref:AAA family ATPase n=1 Tax=Pseudomonas sp. 5 TaxID=1619949 RepID=UPI000699100F|nr:AAA family ATPase [Pseudomonas sp. 5]
MRIDRVEISNFHGIEKVSFNLHPGVTVLLGNNAAGKSAVLDSLAVLAGSYFLGVDGINSLAIKKSDARQERRIQTDGSTELSYYLPCALHADGQIHDQALSWGRELETIEGNTRKGNARALEQLSTKVHQSIVKGERVVRPFIAYYSAARLGSQKRQTRNQNEKLKDISAGYVSTLEKEGSLWRSQAWFAGLQGRALLGIASAREIYEETKRRLLNLFKHIERPLVDMFYDGEAQKVFVRFEGSDSFTPLEFLSSGYLSVMAMGMDIVYRIFALNPHLGVEVFQRTTGIALIDELDMHLHPKWQGRFVDDLRETFPGLQFIVATHSPFVIQGLRHCYIIDMDKNELRQVGDHVKKSISEVAEDYMNMDEVERSPYFIEQVNAAEDYYTLLKTTDKTNLQDVEAAKKKLDDYEVRYDRDPAFIGLLRAERNASGLDKKE